jgi:putative ABC transport system permease protein
MRRLYPPLFGNEGLLAVQGMRRNPGVLNNIALLAIGISSLLMINTIHHTVRGSRPSASTAAPASSS